MEKEVTVRTPDRKIIYGRLRGSLNKPLVIFVHGLTSHMDEPLFFNGARFFEKKGFSSFRFNLYDGRKGSRILTQSTLKTHASDLIAVASYLSQKGAKKLFVVGHSYGGPTILLSDLSFYRAAVLWDPSYGFRWKEGKVLRKVPALDAYVMRWGIEVLLNKEMVRYHNTLRWESLIENLHFPMKIICAEKGILFKNWRQALKKYPVAGPHNQNFVVIKNADHSFSTDIAMKKLFQETIKFLKARL